MVPIITVVLSSVKKIFVTALLTITFYYNVFLFKCKESCYTAHIPTGAYHGNCKSSIFGQNVGNFQLRVLCGYAVVGV